MNTGKQMQAEFRTWLSPPNPSINHNIACDIHHEGTAIWFIQGGKFNEWKEKGSLLWIRGNRIPFSPNQPFMTVNLFSIFQRDLERVYFGEWFHSGFGNRNLTVSSSSAIIKNIKQMKSALIAYYYFDFKDIAKRDLRGLLSSMVIQLVGNSDGCWHVLHRLYKSCSDGSEQPSEAALTQCLGNMIALPDQIPIYLIFDALDECPNNSGIPSDREKVLNFVQDLFGSDHPNLFVCITSRPEQDISTVLTPLTSPFNLISLHNEGGQRQDIDRYVRSFVQTDAIMRRWRAEDKELVINELPERAGGM